MALVVKNLPARAGNIRDMGLIPGSGRFPAKGNGNPLRYSCLENPMDRGTWKATVHRVAQSQTQLKLISTHTHCSGGNYYSLWELLLNSHWILACLGESMECGGCVFSRSSMPLDQHVIFLIHHGQTTQRIDLHRDHKYSRSVLYYRWSQCLQPVGFIFLRDCYHSWIMIRQ